MNYFTYISNMISHIFLMLFMYLFIAHRFSEKITGLICILIFLALTSLDFCKLILFPDSGLCYVLATVFQILLAQSMVLFISKKRGSQALFVGLSASSYVIAGSIFAVIIKIYTDSFVWALVDSAAIHLAILLFLCAQIREICLNYQEKRTEKNWWELCLIPVFFYCSFSFIACFPYTLFDHPENVPGVIFIVITMFVSYIVVLRYLESESKRSAIYWENMLQESYIQGLKNRYYLVERAEQNLKILHHDLRHYTKIIDSLLEQKNYKEIKNVNGHISHMANENKPEVYCSNLLVNAILSNLMAEALFLNIEVELDARVPKELPVDEYEFTLVIANLFENAIQCVKTFQKEKRSIEVKIYCMDSQLFIQTTNAYEGEILFDAVSKLPKSKKNGNHGLGMQSILAFSKKINGTVGCYLDDGMFRIILVANL